MCGMKKGMLNFTCLGNAAKKCPTSCTYPYPSVRMHTQIQEAKRAIRGIL